MKKRIELPLGLSINDVSNIGQYTHVSGRQYDVGVIRGSEIGTVLNSPSITPRALCTHTGINKWAAFKPTRASHPSGMTIQSAPDGNTFVYLPPDNTSGYSVGQFAGYNHNAPIPEVFWGSTVNYVPSSGTGTSELLITLPEWDIRDFGIDSVYVVSRLEGVFVYEHFAMLTDDFISFKSVSVPFEYKELSYNYNIELEVWYGDTSRIEPKYIKHNDFTNLIQMAPVQEPKLFVYASFPMTVELASKSYNYNNGTWSISYKIFESTIDGTTQQGGSFDIYAKRESDSSWVFQTNVFVNYSNWTNTSGTLSFVKPLDENVSLEFRPA